ncbi:hypothetical protein CDS [Bradyrhizobium sp.]|nr:hypothetical protein CDS [Bradyrhizobium sp.]
MTAREHGVSPWTALGRFLFGVRWAGSLRPAHRSILAGLSPNILSSDSSRPNAGASAGLAAVHTEHPRSRPAEILSVGA